MTLIRTQYLIDQFAEKFAAIPENRWTTQDVQNEAGQRCAFGHCLTEDLRWSKESSALNELFNEFRLDVVTVNDRPSGLFPELHPRARILAALAYMRMLVTPEPPPPKRIICVVIPSHRTRRRDRD